MIKEMKRVDENITRKHVNHQIRAFWGAYFERISLVLFVQTMNFMQAGFKP
jgi:uncharacterized membrane protein